MGAFFFPRQIKRKVSKVLRHFMCPEVARSGFGICMRVWGFLAVRVAPALAVFTAFLFSRRPQNPARENALVGNPSMRCLPCNR